MVWVELWLNMRKKTLSRFRGGLRPPPRFRVGINVKVGLRPLLSAFAGLSELGSA